MKTKMIFFDYRQSFSRFYRVMRLNENEIDYWKTKLKSVKKCEIEIENDFGFLRSFSKILRPVRLFIWLISHQSAVLFSHNKSATSNQSTVLFSHNKSAPAISHQPNKRTACFVGILPWYMESRATGRASPACSCRLAYRRSRPTSLRTSLLPLQHRQPACGVPALPKAKSGSAAHGIHRHGRQTRNERSSDAC
jgi:hypothetical protein